MADHIRNVAVLIFENVEVLDFCGPLEVFSVTGRTQSPAPFSVFTVAEGKGPVMARNRLSVNPRYPLAECPRPDLLVVPGGWGTRQEMNNQRLIEWITKTGAEAELVMSVCTGSLLLGKAGLLDGLAATTHYQAIDLLKEVSPGTEVREGVRFVDNGKVITSAGISAGIDMSLHVVERLLGRGVAEETARYMEYRWEG